MSHAGLNVCKLRPLASVKALVPLTAFYMQYRPFSMIKVAGSSNRRTFVYSGGAAAALAVTGGLGLRPRKAFAQSGTGFDASFLQYQTGVLATAMDHLHSNQGTDSDLYLATGACTQMATYMRSSGIDASIQSSFAGVSPAMIPPNTTFDPNAVYNALQAFVPSMGCRTL